MKYLILFTSILVLFGVLYAETDLQKIDLNRSQLKKILASNELRISVSNDNEPLYIENNKEGFPGFEVDIAEAYAGYLGVKLTKVVPKSTFEEHYRAISKDEVDIALGNSANMERGKLLGFSDPYILTTTAGLVRKSVLPPEPEGEIINYNPFKSVKDLQYQTGIILGVKSYTYNHEVLKDLFGKKFPIYTYITDSLALNALLKNRITCYIADDLFIEGVLLKNPSLRATYRPLLSPVVKKEVSIAFRKYDILLMQDLNFFIRQLKRSGEIDQIRSKYFQKNEWVVKKK
jgi:polar amino acid transport system substrate-binding protein